MAQFSLVIGLYALKLKASAGFAHYFYYFGVFYV